MSTDWIIGEAARLSVAIADPTGAAADPGALRLKTKSPAGTLTTYTYGSSGELVRDGVGNYHADIQLTAAGQWFWRWETDAPNAGAAEGSLSVASSSL